MDLTDFYTLDKAFKSNNRFIRKPTDTAFTAVQTRQGNREEAAFLLDIIFNFSENGVQKLVEFINNLNRNPIIPIEQHDTIGITETLIGMPSFANFISQFSQKLHLQTGQEIAEGVMGLLVDVAILPDDLLHNILLALYGDDLETALMLRRATAEEEERIAIEEERRAREEEIAARQRAEAERIARELEEIAARQRVEAERRAREEEVAAKQAEAERRTREEEIAAKQAEEARKLQEIATLTSSEIQGRADIEAARISSEELLNKSAAILNLHLEKNMIAAILEDTEQQERNSLQTAFHNDKLLLQISALYTKESSVIQNKEATARTKLIEMFKQQTPVRTTSLRKTEPAVKPQQKEEPKEKISLNPIDAEGMVEVTDYMNFLAQKIANTWYDQDPTDKQMYIKQLKHLFNIYYRPRLQQQDLLNIVNLIETKSMEKGSMIALTIAKLREKVILKNQEELKMVKHLYQDIEAAGQPTADSAAASSSSSSLAAPSSPAPV